MRRGAICSVIVLSVAAVVRGDEPDRRAAAEAAIRSAVEAYVAAYNQGDAKALAALWSPEAVYTDRQTGDELVGRAAIEAQFAAVFAEDKGAQLAATTESIDFVSPGVAIERGSAKVERPGGAKEQSTYSAVYVLRDGKWLLDRVTEEDVSTEAAPREALQELAWLVGRWVDQDDQATVVAECDWSRNGNFLVRSFTVQVADRIDMAGMQIIGWDPAAKQIRSWVFDSDGGFGEGRWTKQGNRWYVHQSGVLPDGRKSSSVNILTHLDDNTCTLQSVDRMVDGELQPNVDEVSIAKETTP
jgi:uncharacterized protein (TIGR02246 family)